MITFVELPALSHSSATGLVSVIVPVFNRPTMVQRAVESAVAQTYPHVEVIIIDDGSTDDTPDVLAALCSQQPERVRSLRIENSGAGLAREAGRLAAKGQFIQYLDSDDVLLPNKFAAQVAALNRDPDADICSGPTQVALGAGRMAELLGEQLARERPRTWFPRLLISRQWQTGTPLYRRALTDRSGPWEAQRRYQDWVYEAKVARLNPAVCYISEPTLIFHRAPLERLDNMRQQNPREDLYYFALAQQKVYGYAREAGVSAAGPEFRSFIHHLLATSSRCVDAGLGPEALRLSMLAARGWLARPTPGMALPVSRVMFASLRAQAFRPHVSNRGHE